MECRASQLFHHSRLLFPSVLATQLSHPSHFPAAADAAEAGSNVDMFRVVGTYDPSHPGQLGPCPESLSTAKSQATGGEWCVEGGSNS